MAYRRITVYGMPFHFVLGRTVVKIKGPDGWGSKTVRYHSILGLSEEEHRRRLAAHLDCEHSLSFCLDPSADVAVTPRRIADWIRAKWC